MTDPRDRPPHDGMVTKGPRPMPAQSKPDDNANAEEFYQDASDEAVNALLNQAMNALAQKLGNRWRAVVLGFKLDVKPGQRAGPVCGMQFAAECANHLELSQLLTVAAGVAQDSAKQEAASRIVRPGDREWPGKEARALGVR